MIDMAKVNSLTDEEMKFVYEKVQHMNNINNIKNAVDLNWEYLDEKFKIKQFPVTKNEYELIAHELQLLLNADVNVEWDKTCLEAIKNILEQRTEYYVPIKFYQYKAINDTLIVPASSPKDALNYAKEFVKQVPLPTPADFSNGAALRGDDNEILACLGAPAIKKEDSQKQKNEPEISATSPDSQNSQNSNGFTPYAVENCCIWFEPRHDRFAVVYSLKPNPTPEEYNITYWYSSVICAAYDPYETTNFKDVVDFLTSINSKKLDPESLEYKVYVEQRKDFPPNFVGFTHDIWAKMLQIINN
jgi:hypothetical protein